MLHIRPADLAAPEDARIIVELLDEYARDPMGGGSPLPGDVRRRLPGELARRPGAHALMARLDGEPAGMALCFEGFSTFAARPLLNIHDFMVRAPLRGRGVGRALMAAAEDLARALGCCKLTLEVLEGNAPAQALYRAAGFAGYSLSDETGRALFWQKKLD